MSTRLADRSHELEVKFRLSDNAQAALANHPALSVGHRDQREVSTYFDTPRADLMRTGAMLRVRHRGTQHVQTLKLRNGEAAFGRGEWEWPMKTDMPDLRYLAGTPMAGMANAPLDPVFVTDIQRELRTVHRDGATIEIALDHGHVRAGDAEEEIRELELELKDGDAGDLYRLAIALHADVPMTLGAESKSDRGWRLRTGKPRPAEKHTDVELPDDASAAEAFRRILDNVIAHFMANQPSAASGDAEGVHQMRIAIRRARAALMLFKPTLHPRALAQFTDALRRLGRVFGEARDWDVFCTDMLASAEAGGVAWSWLDLLREPAEALRAAAHAHVATELEAPLLTATVLGLQTWEVADDTPLADLAPDLMAKLDQKVRHRGRHIAKLDDEGLHRLRKSLKKLRYGVEFLAPLLREKDTKQYLHHCKVLLKRLGALNDAVVAVALAEQLGGERQPELAPAVSALAEWAANQRTEVRQRLEADWDKLQHHSLSAPCRGGEVR